MVMPYSALFLPLFDECSVSAFELPFDVRLMYNMLFAMHCPDSRCYTKLIVVEIIYLYIYNIGYAVVGFKLDALTGY
jgi:hypothetical protein